MSTRVVFGALALIALAQSAFAGTYYNPANAASTTGLTTGNELYRTIGCPGSGLLETTCEEAAKPAPTPVVEVAAPVVVEQPAPVIAKTEPEVVAPAPVAVAPTANTSKFDECYSQFAKLASESLRSSASFFPVAK